MTRVPLHPWQRAKRRRSLLRACAIGFAAGIAFQVIVCLLLQ